MCKLYLYFIIYTLFGLIGLFPLYIENVSMCKLTLIDSADVSSMKRHRRRTTVFNEVQLRTLYMHFTYCNFPDPSMFKIIGHLTKLEPQVIKIWFQNERSRQRKRATHIVDEGKSFDLILCSLIISKI